MTQYQSVWDAISDTPDEAENLKGRSALVTAINDRIDEFDWSQTVAAQNIALTQPRISDLRRGKISKFSLEALISIARKVGLTVTIDITTPPTPVSLPPSATTGSGREAHSATPQHCEA